MKLIIVAGPPSTGKTAIIRQIISNLPKNSVAYLKIDVVYATEDTEIAGEFGIPAKKVISGDLCPDHAGIMVLSDAFAWAEKEGADYLIVESAGLCLRCTPYTTESLGIAVLSAISGTHSPYKMSPMIALADVAVVTRIDLVSQAEKEVFREAIRDVAPGVEIIETNAPIGTGLRYLMKIINDLAPVRDQAAVKLRGSPPLGVCTVCVGKKEIGWENHFGVVRRLDGAGTLFRGE
ncbi:MAG: cobalamin biosynthesis protein [Methanocalculus sp. MSAO_Arc1]|uniref:GTP-binding protein n=1 Tax=Methanocalculus TaxID=71151 RepID=UPI000FF436E5|nr:MULTISPECIES: GTP-binding protein [unclassified Methanocalculus]MCP1661488.1 Ni2+-binding GTPase involved in maturation of urease and hydrogenase [Methanocalculus sp. AMF5]RQD79764.1 MAG: cobalamin biosynthesis protein [Methanocalculus sp. MSAO_Arc1]